MKKSLIYTILLLITVKGYSQNDTTVSPLNFSGYLEAYYGYDFSNPADHNRPPFVYSHSRHNEVNLNLGFLKANYQQGIVRANLAIMSGTYANANLAAEPGLLKNIYEANAGVKISKKKSLWVDGGIFASHIGFESAISKDCQTLTRSMLADNSPYYETGVKVTYATDNAKWVISGLFLNGWQVMQRPEGNNTPAFGHQLIFKPTGKLLLNSSSFIGSVYPDTSRRMRYFHNFYGQMKVSDNWDLTLGFDIGAQQEQKGGDKYSTWYSPVAILRYAATERWHIAARGEYFSDPDEVVIVTGTEHGFENLGYSLNLDYNITSNAVWRIEGKGYSSRDDVYTLNNDPTGNNYVFTTSLAVSF